MSKGLPKSLSRNANLNRLVEGIKAFNDLEEGVQQDSGARWPDGRVVYRELYTLADTGDGVEQVIPLDGTVAQLVTIDGGTQIKQNDEFAPLPYPHPFTNRPIRVSVDAVGTTLRITPAANQSIGAGDIIIHYLEAT